MCGVRTPVGRGELSSFGEPKSNGVVGQFRPGVSMPAWGVGGVCEIRHSGRGGLRANDGVAVGEGVKTGVDRRTRGRFLAEACTSGEARLDEVVGAGELMV